MLTRRSPKRTAQKDLKITNIPFMTNGRLKEAPRTFGQNSDLRSLTMPAARPLTEVMPFSEAKARLSELADRVEGQHERIVVTRHGRPSFVLMSPDDLESLEETLDILQDDELMASLRLSRQQAAEGQLVRLRDHI